MAGPDAYTTPTGATVHHGKYSTAIGDDSAILENFNEAIDTGNGHNLIVHGHRPGYDDAGGVFVVNEMPTHVQQVVDALMSNPNYRKGTPICLASCWSGSNGTAQEVANAAEAVVTAPTRPVAFNQTVGQWEQLSDLGMWIRYRELSHINPEMKTFYPERREK